MLKTNKPTTDKKYNADNINDFISQNRDPFHQAALENGLQALTSGPWRKAFRGKRQRIRSGSNCESVVRSENAESVLAVFCNLQLVNA